MSTAPAADNTAEPSDALVVFGFTGDLAARQIIPALFAVVKNKTLAVPVIGVSRSPLGREQIDALLRDSLAADRKKSADHDSRHDRETNDPVDAAAFDRLLSLVRYVSGDYKSPATFDALKAALAGARRPTFYLATPPALFETVIGALGAAGLAAGARVVVEKPFGRDLASAVRLDAVTQAAFAQASIFRIDHYLGKDAPARPEFAAVQRQKTSVFEAMRPVAPGDVVRGRYDGYRAEKGVAPGSDVETFCAMRLSIDSWRWAGVPWYVRAGKKLPATVGEVLVRLKPPPQTLFADTAAGTGRGNNTLRFQLQPSSVIALAAFVKRPGKEFIGARHEFELRNDTAAREQPYERLLGDAMAGDRSPFTGQAAVEAAWAVVDPLLAAPRPCLPYAPGSWGPAAADALIAADGGWHDPTAATAAGAA